MASVVPHGKKWRAHVYRDGRRASKVFRTKAEASSWALARQAELEGVQLERHTVGEAMARYAREVSPRKRGQRWERLRLTAMQRDPIAKVPIPALRPADLSAWRDRRLSEVSDATVRREFNLLQSVLKIARKEWGWLSGNPLDGVGRPKSPPSRRRRISDDEIERVTLALGYDGGPPDSVSTYTACAFLFALETAMRAGEIEGLAWADVHAKHVTLRKTKNGDARDVPLSMRAREIVALLPRDAKRPFPIDGGSRSTLFRRAAIAAGVANLRFHDSRAEAIWRLSKRLDVLELARMIGHRNIASLMFYYATTADELADKLG